MEGDTGSRTWVISTTYWVFSGRNNPKTEIEKQREPTKQQKKIR